MNNQEAKFILSGYRPGGRDAGDARFGEALRQAQVDPTLAVWFTRAQAHDATVAAKLREIAPPAGLREAILAGARVSEAPAKKKNVRRWPVWLGLAASVAFLLGVTAAMWPAKADAAEAPLTKFAMSDALEVNKHGGHGEENNELAGRLGRVSTRLGHTLPVDFAALANSGCRTLNFNGRAVLEVCFQRNGKWFHCYVVRCEDFPELRAKEAPEFAVNDKVTAMTWSDGEHRFVVAGQAGREALAQLL